MIVILLILFKVEERDGLEVCLELLFVEVDEKIVVGVELFILLDDGVNVDWIGIFFFLVVSGLYYYLVKVGMCI